MTEDVAELVERARDLLLERGLIGAVADDSDTITVRATIKAMIDFAALSTLRPMGEEARELHDSTVRKLGKLTGSALSSTPAPDREIQR